MNSKIRIGVLVSGSGSNLQAVMDACRAGKISGDVVCVGSDKPDAFGLKRAEKEGIPTFCVDYSAAITSYRRDPSGFSPPDDFIEDEMFEKQSLFGKDASPEKVRAFLKIRAAAEAGLLSEIKKHDVDLLVLAGFMRTISPYFIDRFNIAGACPRIMNIHPAILPSFPGTDGYGDSFRYGCKVGGCTVHFIDYGEDSGPIIGQKTFPIEPGDTLEDVKKNGLNLEWQLLPECIELFARGRLSVEKKVYALTGGKRFEKSVVMIR